MWILPKFDMVAPPKTYFSDIMVNNLKSVDPTKI